MTAKITVVTAVLNQADALRETIKSVLAQRYPDLACVVVDGASIDGTTDVIQEYADRLAAWVSEPDAGVYDAMNKGWALADMDSYLLFLGAGDRLLGLPDFVPSPGDNPTIYYGRVMLDGGREFVSHADWRLKLYNSLHHQGLLVPRKLNPTPPFDIRYQHYADFDFNQRLKNEAVSFKYISDLSAYAAPGGLTERTEVREMTEIVRHNYGLLWWGLSVIGFSLSRVVPAMHKYHPVKPT